VDRCVNVPTVDNHGNGNDTDKEDDKADEGDKSGEGGNGYRNSVMQERTQR